MDRVRDIDPLALDYGQRVERVILLLEEQPPKLFQTNVESEQMRDILRDLHQWECERKEENERYMWWQCFNHWFENVFPLSSNKTISRDERRWFIMQIGASSKGASDRFWDEHHDSLVD